jgi:hypothetical protein
MSSRTFLRHAILGCLASTACNDLGVFDKGNYCIFPFSDAPIVALMDLDDGDTIGQNPSLVAEVRDDQSAPEALAVEWSVDGQPVCQSAVVDADGRILCSPSLEFGPHSLSVRVTDEHGGSGADGVEVIVENDPPEVRIIDPVDGATVTAGFTLTAEAWDSRSPPDALEVAWTVDSMGVCADSVLDDDGLATCALELSEGPHTITFSAEDEHYGFTRDTIHVVAAPE